MFLKLTKIPEPFRSEVQRVGAVLGYSLKGFEHQVELPYFCEITAAAHGTGNFVFLDKAFHLLV